MALQFDISGATINGKDCPVVKKHTWAKNHEIDKDVINLGEGGLDLALRIPPNLPQGDYDLVLKLRIG